MANVALVGTQWGDEGKGKVVDWLTEHFDVVARYQGGNNAGHTVIIGGRQHVLHLLPSGILHPDKSCVIGNGVVVDPEALFEEIEALEAAGIDIDGRLLLSERAHLILPYHRGIELGSEERRGADMIGTTSRGIGPCYEDKMARSGIRVIDCLDPDILARKVIANVGVVNKILEHLYDRPPFDADEIIDAYAEHGRRLRPYATDTAIWLNRRIAAGKSILFEGAQGTHLDVDHGTYPFVTSSNATVGGVCSGLGIGPTSVDSVLGVAKAYTTRVGEGPLPSQLDGDLAERLQRSGREFGATTGRPRRCGWFDAVAVRYAAMVNGCDALVLTKLDVLDGMDKVEICIGYRVDGEQVTEMTAETWKLTDAEPICEEMPGWAEPTKGTRRWEDLPVEARNYVARIGELVGCPVGLTSTGAERHAMLRRPSSPIDRWLPRAA
ncbi:MAG: adenylosuccinate synthase [Acidobacteriota bacterium]